MERPAAFDDAPRPVISNGISAEQPRRPPLIELAEHHARPGIGQRVEQPVRVRRHDHRARPRQLLQQPGHPHQQLRIQVRLRLVEPDKRVLPPQLAQR
ncbi:MAG TPA: hypothetical protein VLS89_02325, partial [Candidatus Nanopelagicales bacterium]|nr:hypothetical protein [Candidatus Nanopelagicales bacterium]